MATTAPDRSAVLTVNDLIGDARRGRADIRTLLVGSLLVTAVAMAVALPLGLGAAIYLAEYARPRVRRTLKPILEVLAGGAPIGLLCFPPSLFAPEGVQR